MKFRITLVRVSPIVATLQKPPGELPATKYNIFEYRFVFLKIIEHLKTLYESCYTTANYNTAFENNPCLFVSNFKPEIQDHSYQLLQHFSPSIKASAGILIQDSIVEALNQVIL